MTWTADDERGIRRALLGSWPGTVVAWGAEAIDAYLYVLQARGLTAEQVMRAIGTWPAGSDFPPSAPNLAAQALKDPSKPTFEEAYALIYGRGGVLRARLPYDGPVLNPEVMRDAAARRRMEEIHPLVSSFIARYGLTRLRLLEVDDPVWGEVRRKELREAYDRHCEAMDGRDVAALASGQRRGEIGRLDPLAALGARPTARISSSTNEEGDCAI